jgi:uncharacterized protein YbaA (DUF1428 family)
MGEYVDGFVLKIQKKNKTAYKKMAKDACKMWLKYGALEYREAFADDLKIKMGVPFTKLLKLKKNETVVFAWVVYKSKKQRDEVNKKIFAHFSEKDMDMSAMPFDMNQMSYGGFDIVVSGKKGKKR